MAGLAAFIAADFSEFVNEGKRAEDAITRLQGGAVKTEGALSRMATGPIAPINTLRESFGQVDSILMASNVNVGRYARGLIEIGDMAGKTVSEIGLLSAGISVASAAMAGWKIGRAIAEFFDLDTKIGNATAKLLGWGDVAGETAAAKADVLARATENAGRTITNYSEAIQINIDAMKDARAATVAAVRPESDLMRAWNESAAAAEDYTGSWTKLHEASTIYGDGLPEVTEKTKTLIEVLDEILQIQGPLQEGFRFTSTTVGELSDEFDALADKVEAAKAAEEAHRTSATDRAIESTAPKVGSVGSSLEVTSQNFSGIIAMRKSIDPIAALAMAKEGYSFDEITQIFRNFEYGNVGPLPPPRGPRIPGFAGGVENFAGGLARVHGGELLVNLPKGTDVIPAGGGRGGGNTYHIHLSGMVGDRAGLARSLQQVLVDGERAAGKRLPAGGRA